MIRPISLARRPMFFSPMGGGKPANAAKPSVVAMTSPNQNSRGGIAIDAIVLHHTAGGGTAQDVGRYFQKSSAQTSSHYIVGKDGVIVQPVADERRAWHAGRSSFKGRPDVNDFSLGIEIVNRGDDKDPYTDAQYRSLAKLVCWMQDEYGIGWDRVTGHKDVALPAGRKSDPSKNFSYDRLKREVAALRAPAAPKPKPLPLPLPLPSTLPVPAPPTSLAPQIQALVDRLAALELELRALLAKMTAGGASDLTST